MQSSSTRRKTPFVPWLAVLVIGATAHAGWLIHELREPSSTSLAIHIDALPRVVVQARGRHSPPARARSLAPSCRHASGEQRGRHQALEPELDLDLWIRRSDRYSYTIDRRALERVALADHDLGELEGLRHGLLGLADPIELRNIQVGTPLFVLGLRTGDRLVAIATRGGAALERVELAVERRGRPISLVYELI